MRISDSVKFDHNDRQQVYEYVESHGTVVKKRLMTGTTNDQRAVGHHIAILKRDGYLEETEDGHLQIALDLGKEKEEFSIDDAEFTIRPARQKDLTGITGAIRQVSEEMTYIVAESVADEIDHQNVLLRHNELESRMFFVMTINNDVVGWVHLYAPELEKLAHTAELTIGIIEEYRGQGLGSHLLTYAVEWAASNGFEKLYNSVPSTNEVAIEFLKTRSWEIEAVRKDHYKMDDEYIDEVMMAVEL